MVHLRRQRSLFTTFTALLILAMLFILAVYLYLTQINVVVNDNTVPLKDALLPEDADLQELK